MAPLMIPRYYLPASDPVCGECCAGMLLCTRSWKSVCCLLFSYGTYVVQPSYTWYVQRLVKIVTWYVLGTTYLEFDLDAVGGRIMGDPERT